MKIGIFTDTYAPHINGVATSILMLENALRKLGHDVYIVTINPDELSYNFENDARIIRIPGIPTGIYDYRLSGIYPIKAVNKVKEWNLDIIHSHTEFGIGAFARIMAKQLDIPVVHTYHTMYEDYVHYITKGHFDAPSKKVVEYITKFFCDKTAKELIVPTKKTYDLFKKKYKFDRNVHIIPTGIEVERFHKENKKNQQIIKLKYDIKENDFIIIFVGRIAKEKNINFLIEEHAILTKRNKHAKLLIVGDGPDSDELKSLAKKLHISNNVIFTGKVPWNEIPDYYHISDVFVTASHTETQGLTLIEAMAASLPAITYDDEAFNSIVIDDLNGYLFKDKRSYRKNLEKLIDDKELKEKLGRQARINSDTYSSKYYAERVLDVYNLALEGRNQEKRSFFDKAKDVVRKGFHGE